MAALSAEERPRLGSPDDVANVLSIEMVALEQEQLRVVPIGIEHRILGSRTGYQGNVNHKRDHGPLSVGAAAPRHWDSWLFILRDTEVDWERVD